ncbi:MAG: peptidyl-prolyl cis-trans isomerase [Acidobacteria bacterium]|nr:peptidyl-prolyl cis-trans isomerase [Acidobacteriota bacterium]
MFDVFRSQRKSVKYLLTFLLGLVGLSMVITLVPGLFSTPTMDLSNPVLVEVGDEQITDRDVRLRLNEMIPPGQDVSSLMGLMAGQALESLVTERVLLAEADRLGLKPNDRQLAEWIREQIPALFPGGQFDSAQYSAMVQQRFNMQVPDFERRLMVDLTIQGRLQSMVTDSVVVTEPELRRAFAEQNEQARIQYALVDTTPFRSVVDASDANVTEYFNNNRFRYQTEETRSVVHVSFVAPAASAGTQISDAEIRNFYDQNRYRFETPDRVHPSHILFLTINPDTGAALTDAEKAAKQTLANEVLAKVKAGEDFAALATQYSEDPGTKEEGGDLGFVARGQMGTAAFEDPTFALQPGEVTDVVETEFGFHIIKMNERESAVRRPLEEVREEIIGDLRAEKGALERQNREDQALIALRNATPENVEQVAASLGFPAQAFNGFTPTTAPPQISRTPQLRQAIFAGTVGELIPHADENGMVAALVTDITPARDMTFEEARLRAVNDYLTAEARTMAEAKAAELLAAAKNASLAEAAASLGLEVVASDPFRRDDQVPGLASAQTLSAAFTASTGELQGPLAVGPGYVVFAPTELIPADMTGFVGQRAALREQLLGDRRAEAFEIFRDALTTRYQAEGKIRRYEARIQLFLGQAGRTF